MWKVVEKGKEYVILEGTMDLNEALSENWMDGAERDEAGRIGKKILGKDVSDSWESPDLSKCKVRVQLFSEDDKANGFR